MEKRPTRGTGNYLGLIIMAVLFFTFFSPLLRNSFTSGGEVYTREDFIKDLQGDLVERVEITPNRDNATGYAAIVRTGGERQILYATVISDIEDKAREAGVVTVVHDIPSENTFVNNTLPMLLVMGICFLFFYLMSGQSMGGGNARMMNFGKSKARLSTGENVTFKQVAGLDEEKADLEEIIDFLRSPEKYTPAQSRKIYKSRRPDPQGRSARGSSRNGQDPSGQSGCRRGQSALFHYFRFGFRGNVRRCRRIPCPRHV